MALRTPLFGSRWQDSVRRSFGMDSSKAELRFETNDLHLDDSISLYFGDSDDVELQFDGTNFLMGTTGTTVFGDGAAEAVLQSNGNFDLVLQTGNTTTPSIRITDGNNANITLAPTGTGQTVIGTGAAEGILESNGDQDLLLQTGNTTTGTIRITDGNNANITLTPTGTGETVIGSGAAEGILSSSGDNDLLLQTGNTTTGSIRITDGDNADITLTTQGTGDVVIANGAVVPDQETVTNGSPALQTWGSTNLDSSGGAITGTLGSPSATTAAVGQLKHIVMQDASNSSTITIADHETEPNEVATFDAVDEYLLLAWTGTEWATIKATCTFV